MVLIAVFLILQLTEKPPPEIPPVEIVEVPFENSADLTFTDLSSEYVIRISVINPLDEYIIEWLEDYDATEFENTGRFGIEDLGDTPVIQGSFDAAARYVSRFTAREIVAENVADLALIEYGLSDEAPRAKVTAIFSGGQEPLSLIIGDEALTGDNLTYFRFEDDNTVYAAWTYLFAHFLNDRRAYVSLQVEGDYAEMGMPEVQRVTIRQPEQPRYVIEPVQRDPEIDVIASFNSHKLTVPVEVELDYEAANGAIFGLFGLVADEIAYATGLKDGEFSDEITGLDAPLLTVNTTFNDKIHTLTLGNSAGPNKYYGKYSENPDVIYIFDGEIPWLDFEPEKFMAKQFVLPYIYSLSDFIIETNQHLLHFEITGDDAASEKFYLNGEEVEDANLFKSLYQFCIRAGGDRFFEGSIEDIEEIPMTAKFTYKYRGNRDDFTVAFHEGQDWGSGRYAALVTDYDTDNTLLLSGRMSYLNRLLQNIEFYLNGEDIIMSW